MNAFRAATAGKRVDLTVNEVAALVDSIEAESHNEAVNEILIELGWKERASDPNMIKIEDINSAGIQAQARKEGITELRLIGDNGERGDAKITVYWFGGTKVANTNADPIWEDQDPEAWAELMETIQPI